MRSAAKMFPFDPNPTRAKNAWSSYTCLLYGGKYRLAEGGGVELFQMAAKKIIVCKVYCPTCISTSARVLKSATMVLFFSTLSFS